MAGVGIVEICYDYKTISAGNYWDLSSHQFVTYEEARERIKSIGSHEDRCLASKYLNKRKIKFKYLNEKFNVPVEIRKQYNAKQLLEEIEKQRRNEKHHGYC